LLEADRLGVIVDKDSIWRLFNFEFPRTLTGDWSYETLIEVMQEVRFGGNVSAPPKIIWTSHGTRRRLAGQLAGRLQDLAVEALGWLRPSGARLTTDTFSVQESFFIFFRAVVDTFQA
jgi:hypothetical protein